jgi:hypothetical protein
MNNEAPFRAYNLIGPSNMVGFVYSADIEDADAWVAKALLMGAILTQNSEKPSTHTWRWSGFLPSGHSQRYINWPLAQSDWPGRCAKAMVEEMQRMERLQRALEADDIARRRNKLRTQR